jgi:UreF
MTATVGEIAAPNTAVRLSRLLQFGDSMFPIGGFSFSGGLESAIQKGVVSNVTTLQAFARTAVEQAAMGDGIALIWAHRAALAGDLAELERIDQQVYGRKLSAETRTMTVRVGKKFAENYGLADSARLAPAHSARIHAGLLSRGIGRQFCGAEPGRPRRIHRAPVRGWVHDSERCAETDESQPCGNPAHFVRT